MQTVRLAVLKEQVRHLSVWRKGQRARGKGLRAMGNGQRTMGNGQEAKNKARAKGQSE